MKSIVLGGGCFWCIEAIYQRIEGVTNVVPGYAGGNTQNPTYEEVCKGNTGHAEVVKVEYDPNLMTLEKLLKVFFLIHNPTTLNKQGADVGSQYRSIILYQNNKEKEIIDNVIEDMGSEFDDEIVTEVKKLKKFYKSEDYHINYYNNNPNAGYCRIVIKPKLEKLVDLKTE
jgi:methionine-S-sulfoxide reductase